MILIEFSAAFGAIMTYMQLPTQFIKFLTTLLDNKYLILMYLNVILLIGTLMDMASIILILMLLLLSTTNLPDDNPVHFDIIMMLILSE